MPFSQIVFTLDIGEGLYTCHSLGLVRQTRSVEEAVDGVVSDLLIAHNELQGVEDEMLSEDGINLRDTPMVYVSE